MSIFSNLQRLLWILQTGFEKKSAIVNFCLSSVGIQHQYRMSNHQELTFVSSVASDPFQTPTIGLLSLFALTLSI